MNAVSGSLIRAPDFKIKTDLTRADLIAMADHVSCYDAEFVLKVALYTRCELNIRTTANFLLAFASFTSACRPYLKKYFSASIRLPSDWIDVAELYQVGQRFSQVCFSKMILDNYPCFAWEINISNYYGNVDNLRLWSRFLYISI